MKVALYSTIVAMMVWLPISQAAALCCPPVNDSADVHAAMAEVSHHCDEHLGSGSSGATTLGANCLSACVQLGHVPVPVVNLAGAESHPTAFAPVQLAIATLPAHRTPLLRPPPVS